MNYSSPSSGSNGSSPIENGRENYTPSPVRNGTENYTPSLVRNGTENYTPSLVRNGTENYTPSPMRNGIENYPPSQRANGMENYLPSQRANGMENYLPSQRANGMENCLPSQRANGMENYLPLQRANGMEKYPPSQRANGRENYTPSPIGNGMENYHSSHRANGMENYTQSSIGNGIENYTASSVANGIDSYFSTFLHNGENANGGIVTPLEPQPSSSRSSVSPPFVPPRTQARYDLMTSTLLQAISKIEDSTIGESQLSSPVSITCSKCELRLGTNKCKECHDVFCHECLDLPSFDCAHNEFVYVSPSQMSPTALRNFNESSKEIQCEAHCETFRYYCRPCCKLVCQECTLWEHKDHKTVYLRETNSPQVLRMQVLKLLESGRSGIQLIKHSIDLAVSLTRTVDKEATNLSSKVQKTLKPLSQAVIEREKMMLDEVERIRLFKINELTSVMQGLRSALAGLADTNENLTKAIENDDMDMNAIKERAQSHLKLYSSMFRSLRPKDQPVCFLPPTEEFVKAVTTVGEIKVMQQDDKKNTDNANNTSTNNNNNSSDIACSQYMSGLTLDPRAIKRPESSVPPSMFGFAPAPSYTQPIPPHLTEASRSIRRGAGLCIPNSPYPVTAKKGWMLASKIFGTEGHEDGQVSRPWGLCVDRGGNIIVADRRNNRVQVFGPDGVFKRKFGTKGIGPGEFDLPAGITTDNTDRIIVVDKDNHRVQIFTPSGSFILAFGMYGKNTGQFRYPWDVAVNSQRTIVVTDTRNYRVQMFEPDGTFVTMIVFDGINHNRNLKGLTTPRGICFTPLGDIIVSDFENHRLLLINASLEAVMGARGYEGLGIGEFSRPSGIICDDEGRIIVADSKNHRVLVFSRNLQFLWSVDIKGFGNEENDRPTDVGLTPSGRLLVIVEGALDSREIVPVQQSMVKHPYLSLWVGHLQQLKN